MWTRISLKTKLTFLVVSVIIISTFTFARFTLNHLASFLDKVVGLRAETAAMAVLDHTMTDWSTASMTTGSLDSAVSTTRASVERLIGSGYVDRVEVVRFDPEKSLTYLLSLPVDQSHDYHEPGTTEQVVPGSLLAQERGHYPVQLDSGIYVAGMVPVTNGGQTVGSVVVFIDRSETQAALDAAQWAIIMAMGTFVLLAGLTAYKFSATFEKAAVTDGLMGIYNHKHFKQRLDEETAKSRRYKQQTSLVLLDIDFFKRVNDTYGHATGDLVLKSLAKWVTESTRNSDVVARYGGEEIAIILPHTGLAGAQEFAERLRIKISNQVVRDPEEDAEFRVTVSIGVTQWELGVTALDMIKRADAALYHSKRTGRNRVTIYQDEILPQAAEAHSPVKG